MTKYILKRILLMIFVLCKSNMLCASGLQTTTQTNLDVLALWVQGVGVHCGGCKQHARHAPARHLLKSKLLPRRLLLICGRGHQLQLRAVDCYVIRHAIVI